MCMIAGWISGHDLKESEAISVRDWRELGGPLVAAADMICPLENVRDEPRGCTAPVAWASGGRKPSRFSAECPPVLHLMNW